MKIYMAGRYGRRDELRSYIRHLHAAEHTSCARWLTDEDNTENLPPKESRRFAILNMEDISKCDVLISFTEEEGTPGACRGGRQVEYGAAIAWEKPVILVGPREHLFHHLPNVPRFDTLEEALESLKG